MKSIRKWILVIVTIVAITTVWFAIAKAGEDQHKQEQVKSKQEVLVCPKCGIEATGAKKFCSADGVPIVPKSFLKKDPITELKLKALESIKYLENKRIANGIDTATAIQERMKLEQQRWREKEISEQLQFIDALDMTQAFVDNGGVWDLEHEYDLVVGYYPNPHTGEPTPAWKDFSVQFSKLKNFEIRALINK